MADSFRFATANRRRDWCPADGLDNWRGGKPGAAAGALDSFHARAAIDHDRFPPTAEGAGLAREIVDDRGAINNGGIIHNNCVGPDPIMKMADTDEDEERGR